MLLKHIRFALVTLLLAGCVPTLGATSGANVNSNSYFHAPKQKFNVVVLTPGTAQKQMVANGTNSQRATGTPSEVQQLPNYKGETLTLGLLSK